MRNEIKKLGNVNVNAIEEYKELSERHTFLNAQHEDLVEAEKTLLKIIDELDIGMRHQFEEKFAQIREEFDKAFKELFGGGKGTIELDEEEDILEAGIRIISQPPGKKLQNMMQLSGGEKALTAIALLFAIQNLKPSPFCLLDEIEAALDDSNVTRYARYLHKLTKNTQFIIITHRRGTMTAADRLYAAQDKFIVESFGTIAAYGGNAAMMHYHATEEDHAKLERKGFLLVDSGATYLDGTTDITRTYPLGELTEDEKLFYTWTLQCHIDIAKAVWLNYCDGHMLDTIAREPLWQHLINYRCGTGHSVSFVGNVHEGPHALNGRNTTVFQPGMIVTDEPGVYEAGQVGIRIENELECYHKADNQYGTFLAFRPLTFVPIATSPVVPGVLNRDELDWLNAYHREVFEKLAPRLNEEERDWLAKKCAAIGA